MRVTTTTANGSTYVHMKSTRADLDVRVNDGESPAEALQRQANEWRTQANRLAAMAARCDAAADILLTPAA